MGDAPSWSVAADRRFRRLLLLSVVVHLLLLVVFIGQRGQQQPGTKGSGQRSPLEITLSKPKAAVSPPQPVAPKPVPKAAPQEPVKTKPPRKQPDRLAVRKPNRPPQRPSKPREPEVPEFRDDFAERSRTYSRQTPELIANGSNGPAGDGGLGISPGSIANINPRIVYPRQAQMRGHQGVVVVLIHIGTDGSAQRVELLRSSGYPELDEQVLGAVQHWRFIPPRRGHMPVESVFKHTVVFGAEERIDDFEHHWREIRLLPAS
ncbi:energy transducer TonB [Methyloterricola oryzae]|uniref:energy transducer TonB n=1 Tax=Methyloterricola oryzae TaxID=1495050 RepID=UPI0005EB9262|nr:energy transducer TonB [Methyloterricola oryzae]